MLDLNLDLSLLKGSTCDDTDSNPNADDGEFMEDNAVAGEGDDSGISNVSSDVITAAVDGSDCTTFKFSILDKSRNDGDVIIIEDDYDCGQPGLKTRQLFPVAEVEEISSFPLNTRPRHWLNLAVPEAVGATEASGSRAFGVAGKHVTQLPKSPPQTGKKSRRGPRSRSSQYRGVTFYRRTGRWESHIWDCRKQVYLGGFDTSYAAARAYDRAAIKFRGVNADINFHISDYEKDIQQMKNLTKEEFIQVLRPRQNGGISRSSSKYKCGEAQINHFKGAFEISNLKGDAILSFEHNTIGKNALQFFNQEDRCRSLDLNLWDSEPLVGKRLKILDTSTSTQENSTSHNYTSTWNNKQKEEIRDSKPWLIRSNSQTGPGKFNMTRFPQFLSVLRQHHQDSNPQTSPMNTRNMVRYPPLALQKP